MEKVGAKSSSSSCIQSSLHQLQSNKHNQASMTSINFLELGAVSHFTRGGRYSGRTREEDGSGEDGSGEEGSGEEGSGEDCIGRKVGLGGR